MQTASSRARTRAGRRVRYIPTAAQITTYGAGDFIGRISDVSRTAGTTIAVTGPNGTEFVVTGARVGSRPGQYDFFGGVTP